jgi:hypothetical protein
VPSVVDAARLGPHSDAKQLQATLLCRMLATRHNIVMELLGRSPIALLRQLAAGPFFRSATRCADGTS